MEKDNLTYERKILIRSEQVDMTRYLRMSDLFRLLEEASIAHTEELGCTKDKTLDRGLLWVITRQLVEIGEMPYYDKEITVRSWQGDMQHVFFPRFYEIEMDGRVIIRGQALWMLIEEESRSMIMPEDYGISLPGRPGSDDMILPAIVIPKELTDAADTDESSVSMITRFSQVDINGHMNNTRYFDMIDDMMHGSDDAAGISGKPALAASHAVPKTVLANYFSELRLGDGFTMKRYADEKTPGASSNTMYFEGIAGTKPYFRIKYEY